MILKLSNGSLEFNYSINLPEPKAGLSYTITECYYIAGDGVSVLDLEVMLPDLNSDHRFSSLRAMFYEEIKEDIRKFKEETDSPVLGTTS